MKSASILSEDKVVVDLALRMVVVRIANIPIDTCMKDLVPILGMFRAVAR